MPQADLGVWGNIPIKARKAICKVALTPIFCTHTGAATGRDSAGNSEKLASQVFAVPHPFFRPIFPPEIRRTTAAGSTSAAVGANPAAGAGPIYRMKKTIPAKWHATPRPINRCHTRW